MSTRQTTSDADAASALEQQLQNFILGPEFPCVGAKSAVRKASMTVYCARDIESAWNDIEIHDRLMNFAWRYKQQPTLFTSFAVVFERQADLDEEAFEAALWARVQSLADKDSWLGQPHDPRVSQDPQDPHFSLSFGGEAFFVVGLHPNASRRARRFDYPTMVFNLHDQFVQLREQNRYEKLRKSILDRDMEYSGSLNPMLARHGSISEARQYSGRAVDPDWTCPFDRKAQGPALITPRPETKTVQG